MKIVTGYSIWIVPTGNVKRKLSKLMAELSKKFDAPAFSTPHVTLYENLHGNKNELILKTKELAKSIKPFRIKLTRIDEGKNFDNLVILVRKTRELANAYLKAKKIFGIGKKIDLEFEAKSIYLVPIGKNPLRWIPVKRFNLGK